jgi:PhnB protein
MTTVTPYLMVESARPFIDFVTGAFDGEIAEVVPLPADSDRVMHGEARLGEGMLYFADCGPDGGQCQAFPEEPSHLQLWTTVPDADQVYARAVAQGAVPVMEVAAQDDGGRVGGFAAFGVLWWVTTVP